MRRVFFIITTVLLFTTACQDEKDLKVPEIDMSASDAFPVNCVTVYRGEAFNFVASFTDDIELGSYAIEIHHNFDHHSHSTSSETCTLDEKKDAVNPWVYQKDFSIPEKQTGYRAQVSIEVPSDIDLGDYHFYVRLTDKSGWSTYEGISFKIADR